MALTRWRRPRVVTLPGGFKIPILYWSERKIQAALAKDHDPVMAYGYWDGKRIVINSSEPVWTQVKILGHELVHAANDYSHWLEETIVDPMKGEAGQTLMEDDDED